MYRGDAERFLRRFGVDSTYKGYRYFIYGAALAEEHPEWLQCITKSIYPETAKRYRTSWSCVERNIRTVVETVWRNGGREHFSEASGVRMGARPTNTQFFELVLEYVLPGEPAMDTCGTCRRMRAYEERIASLEAENRKLQETVAWMHELIWRMIKEREGSRGS